MSKIEAAKQRLTDAIMGTLLSPLMAIVFIMAIVAFGKEMSRHKEDDPSQ